MMCHQNHNNNNNGTNETNDTNNNNNIKKYRELFFSSRTIGILSLQWIRSNDLSYIANRYDYRWNGWDCMESMSLYRRYSVAIGEIWDFSKNSMRWSNRNGRSHSINQKSKTFDKWYAMYLRFTRAHPLKCNSLVHSSFLINKSVSILQSKEFSSVASLCAHFICMLLLFFARIYIYSTRYINFCQHISVAHL